MTAPLEDIRVVDLTRLVAGDYCTSLLQSLGAEVVKIEDPHRGDHIGEFGGSVNGVPVARHLFNRGKRSVCIDLKRPEGQDLLRRLVAGADVLVESFRPGVMGRLGLDSAQALDLNPRLVWVSISAYGATGDRAQAPGHDLNYLAESGFLDRLVGTDGRPVPPAVPIADLIGGGLIPALTAVSMVLRAQRTGEGGVVDASIVEGMALLPSVLLADLTAGVHVPADGRETLLGGAYACYDVYALADGYAVVGALEPVFWRTLCETLELPELVPLQWHAPAQDQVHAALEKAFGALTKADIGRLHLDEGACVSVVSSYEESIAIRRDSGDEWTVAAEAGFRAPGLPFRIDGQRLRPAAASPRRGEHTRAVLAELGIDQSDVSALAAADVVRAYDDSSERAP